MGFVMESFFLVGLVLPGAVIGAIVATSMVTGALAFMASGLALMGVALSALGGSLDDYNSYGFDKAYNILHSLDDDTLSDWNDSEIGSAINSNDSELVVRLIKEGYQVTDVDCLCALRHGGDAVVDMFSALKEYNSDIEWEILGKLVDKGQGFETPFDFLTAVIAVAGEFSQAIPLIEVAATLESDVDWINCASAAHNAAFVKQALEYADSHNTEIDFNQLNNMGVSPLVCAKVYGAVEIADLLTERGAKVIVSPQAYEAQVLCQLVDSGIGEMLEFLHNYAKAYGISIDWNAANSEGKTPMMIAAENNDTEIFAMIEDYLEGDSMHVSASASTEDHAVEFLPVEMVVLADLDNNYSTDWSA